MAALAIYLKKKGHVVEGLDTSSYIYTQDELIENNIIIYSFENYKLDYVDIAIIGHSFVDKNLDVIYYLKEELIPIYEYHEFINMIQEEYKESVAICGSHGKTTVTKLLHHCLNFNNNCSCIVGDGSANVEASNDLLVFEACEYQNHFFPFAALKILLDSPRPVLR